MTVPRKQQISLSDTPYYHVTSRCVRRAYLCGFDHLSQKSYEHRRQWIEDRIRLLSSLFTIEILSYAIMSNHFHIILKITPEESESWDTKDIINRWLSLYKGPLVIQKFHAGEVLSKAELSMVSDYVTVWRKRLCDISWFMKCLNEPIAKQANKEDQCTGHFWEARYRSQPLLTEEALLCCMTYVDLNPVRAGIAETPEDSDFTSFKERIKPQFSLSEAIQSFVAHGGFGNAFQGDAPIPIKPLADFTGSHITNNACSIPFEFTDYLQLVDIIGRAIRDDKHSYISETIPPALQRLKTSETEWLENSRHFERLYHSRFGKKQRKKKIA